MHIQFTDQQSNHTIDPKRCVSAARMVAEDAGYKSVEISIAIVDDETMHELNRRHLDHDYPTDVLSFVLDDDAGCLTGEVIVSADTADRNSRDYGWAVNDEVLLCVVHGVLHLTGYDDTNSDERKKMHERERFFLSQFGLQRPGNDDEPPVDEELKTMPNDAATGGSAS